VKDGESTWDLLGISLGYHWFIDIPDLSCPFTIAHPRVLKIARNFKSLEAAPEGMVVPVKNVLMTVTPSAVVKNPAVQGHVFYIQLYDGR
jgi:hypothetical protein